jgi:cyclohexyl-isocyanide hydratase
MTALRIGFLLFPQVTQLDLTGPLQVLYRLPGAKVEVVAKTRDPVASDCGLSLVPTADFAGCGALDMICIPGGIGVLGALADNQTMDFVRRQGERAQWVTSVCTGAFLLGAAGLLQGRRATTHWAYVDLLPLVGATHERARVVRDGHVVTGGGVTAGIDFALTLVAEIAGREAAQAIGMSIEYDPAPPFACAPAQTPTEVQARVAPVFAERVAQYRSALARAQTAGG